MSTAKPQRKTGIGATGKGTAQEAVNTVPSAADLDKTAELNTLIREAFEANEAANAQANVYKKKRAALLRMMQDMNKTNAQATFKKGDIDVTLRAEIGASVRDTIDVHKLRELVPDDKIFMTMVSASIGAVEANVGGNIANQCKVSNVGETNVSVKVAK